MVLFFLNPIEPIPIRAALRMQTVRWETGHRIVCLYTKPGNDGDRLKLVSATAFHLRCVKQVTEYINENKCITENFAARLLDPGKYKNKVRHHSQTALVQVQLKLSIKQIVWQ